MVNYTKSIDYKAISLLIFVMPFLDPKILRKCLNSTSFYLNFGINRFSSNMSSQMTIVIGSSSSSFPTNSARVRLFSCMCFEMVCQIISSRKTFITSRATRSCALQNAQQHGVANLTYSQTEVRTRYKQRVLHLDEISCEHLVSFAGDKLSDKVYI